MPGCHASVPPPPWLSISDQTSLLSVSLPPPRLTLHLYRSLRVVLGPYPQRMNRPRLCLIPPLPLAPSRCEPCVCPSSASSAGSCTFPKTPACPSTAPSWRPAPSTASSTRATEPSTPSASRRVTCKETGRLTVRPPSCLSL